jgi:hypothetical protein
MALVQSKELDEITIESGESAKSLNRRNGKPARAGRRR